jgi:hypothetical protein
MYRSPNVHAPIPKLFHQKCSLQSHFLLLVLLVLLLINFHFFFFFFFFFGRSHCLLPLLLCRAVALRPNPLLRLTFRRSSALSPLDCRVGFTIAWRSESQGGPGQLKRRRARTHRKTSLVELRSRRSFLLLFLTRRGQAARDAVTREIERAFKPILC